MVVIRLARTGAKKKPFYHIVVADKRIAVQKRYIERLGYYNPVARGNTTRLLLDLEKLDSWVAKGAQLSERVAKLVKDYRKQQTDTAA